MRKGKRLILLHGKPGQGKSTLVADYLKNYNKQALWFNLDIDDSDPFLFLKRLLVGIINQKEEYKKYFNEVESTRPGDSPEHLFDILISCVELEKDRHFCIVLDNFDRIAGSQRIQESINYLIEAVPDNVDLFILSRVYPQLAIHKFRSDNKLLEINDNNLAFTTTEVNELFKRIYAISLSPGLADNIREVCGGWAIALGLLSDTLQNKPDEDRKQFIDKLLQTEHFPAIEKYFTEEIFDKLELEKRELFTRLAVFNQITPELINKIPGYEEFDTHRVLEQRNLFLEIQDQEKKIYSFTRLFSKFLLTHFRNLPDNEKIVIHKLAAEFYFNRGEVRKVFDHLILGEDYPGAENIFLRDADELMKQGQYNSLRKMVETFPADIRKTRPLLLYYHAITTNLINPIETRKILNSLISYFRETEDWNREAKIYSIILTNFLFYQENRETVTNIINTATAFLAKAERHLDPENKEVLKSLIPLGKWWIMPDSDEAIEMVLKSEETSFRFNNEEGLLFSRIVLSRMYLDRGEFQDSKNILITAEKRLNKSGATQQYEALLRFYLGDTFFYIGDLSYAIQQVKKGLETPFQGFAFRPYLELNLALYSLYAENTDEAELIIESISGREIGGNLMLRYYCIYLLQMLLAYRKGNRRRAHYYCKRLMQSENEPLLMTDFPYSYLALGEVNLFIEEYDAAETILKTMLERASVGMYPYPDATAFGILGIIYSRREEKKEARKYFQQMIEILKSKAYRNLDICNPDLLRNIAQQCKNPVFSEFLRLKEGLKEDQSTNEPLLEFHTFGEFRVFVNGKEIPEPVITRQKKVIDFLKILIVHRDKGILKERICDIFWRECSPKNSRDNLNTIICRLRKLLGREKEYIVTDTDSIRLKEGTYTIDINKYEEYIRYGDIAEKKGDVTIALNFYHKASSLYSDDFMAKDLYYDDINDERERQKNSYIHFLFKVAKIGLDTGNFLHTIEGARKLISKNPICESAHRLLMIASAISGNRSEIPRIFNTLNEKLLCDYNIQADPKTVELKNRLLSGETPEPSMWQDEILI
jgi:LuxR family maltose regulon positive regulatory protein